MSKLLTALAVLGLVSLGVPQATLAEEEEIQKKEAADVAAPAPSEEAEEAAPAEGEEQEEAEEAVPAEEPE